MTDTETTIEVLSAVVARLERDLGIARLYGEQQCARAEKAEADLAAARECIRWGWSRQRIRPDHKHAPAVAAARAEGDE